MFLSPGWLVAALWFAAPVHFHTEERPVSPPPRDQVRRVAIWTDRSEPYSRGEAARVHLRVLEPSHVAVFRVDTEGRVRVLFPYEPWGDAYLRRVGERVLTGRRGEQAFDVDDEPGVGYLFALASPNPLDFRAIARGEAWDYRLIAGGRLRGDPYVALTDLAARLSPTGRYDYDITPYYVEHRYSHPRFVCYQCHASAANDGWDPYQSECTRYRVIVRDEPRFYPYRYGGNGVVAERPAHPGPRFVLREADGRTGGRADGRADGRTGRRTDGRIDPQNQGSEDRRTEVPSDEPPFVSPSDRPPVRPSDHPSVRPSARPPVRPTGEPELRRRRP